MPEPLRYRSGEEIQEGDQVLLDGNPGAVELVAVNPNDPEHYWYVKTHGGGIMIREPKKYGRLFVSASDIPGEEILEFIVRGDPALVKEPYIEPWLRSRPTEIPAAGRAVLDALQLALEDITKWTAGLTDAEVHSQPLGLTPIAFHLRHIARSADRILTYAEGEQLSAEQLAALKAEQGSEGNQETLAVLLAKVEASFSNAAERIRVLATANLDTPRFVGRKQLPTSIGGVLIHVADHTQRHVGQVVTTAKTLKALRK